MKIIYIAGQPFTAFTGKPRVALARLYTTRGLVRITDAVYERIMADTEGVPADFVVRCRDGALFTFGYQRLSEDAPGTPENALLPIIEGYLTDDERTALAALRTKLASWRAFRAEERRVVQVRHRYPKLSPARLNMNLFRPLPHGEPEWIGATIGRGASPSGAVHLHTSLGGRYYVPFKDQRTHLVPLAGLTPGAEVKVDSSVMRRLTEDHTPSRRYINGVVLGHTNPLGMADGLYLTLYTGQRLVVPWEKVTSLVKPGFVPGKPRINQEALVALRQGCYDEKHHPIP